MSTEKCSLRVELSGETAGSRAVSAVSVDIRGARGAEPFGLRAREKYGEYQVGLLQQRDKQPGSRVGLASPREGPEIQPN